MPLISTSKRHEDVIGDELMTKLRNAKERAAEERTLPAIPLAYTNPLFVVMQSFAQREGSNRRHAKGELQTRTTTIGQEVNFSSTPLQDLKPILLRDMKVRQRAVGRYLLCRVIAPPFRLVATMFAVEDPAGWGQLLSLYNFPGTYSATGPELDTMFPVNSVIAVREPWIKMALLASHSQIRVDSPTDLIIIGPDDPTLSNVKWSTGVRPMPVLSKTAEEWKATGDKHFKAKQYYASIAAYSSTLLRKPFLLNARLNRSLANLRVERNLAAVEDAQVALASKDLSPGDRVKALYRCAQGVYAQGDYISAKEWYAKCLAADKALKEAASGHERCDARIKEQTLGTFDWDAIYEWGDNPNTRADVADFTGPVERVSMQHRGGGRGIIATRDISAGELLVVAKPFASATPQNFVSEGLFFGFNFLNDQIQVESRYVVIQKTIERMLSSTRDAESILELYAGPQYVDLIASPKTRSSSTSNAGIDIDSTRIQSICTLNVFGSQSSKEESVEGRSKSSELYTFPSYFNHSCMSNAERQIIGDIIVIRAVTRINKGEEVTISYNGHGQPYEKRKEMLKTWFPLCDCSLCDHDRHDGMTTRDGRQKLLQSMESGKRDIPKLRILAKKIDSTYKAGYPSYRPAAWDVHRALSMALEGEAVQSAESGRSREYFSRLAKEAILDAFIALEAMGCKITNKSLDVFPVSSRAILPISTDNLPYHSRYGVEMCFGIIGGFDVLQKMRGAEMWMRAALWIDSAWTGGGVRLFKKRYARELALMGELGVALLANVESS